MISYILYENEDFGQCICEVLNEGIEELYSVEKILIEKGYIISKVNGLYIHCYKVKELENQ